LYRPGNNKQVGKINPSFDAVSLFSGGLDSLSGVIDWLSDYPQRRILLVGHYDPAVSGPKSDQKRLFNQLECIYGQRVQLLQVRVGQTPSGKESSYRSRSLLFIALGIYATATLTHNAQLLIPENGTIALNAPLTPSRRGSCSTRTAHPRYLE